MLCRAEPDLRRQSGDLYLAAEAVLRRVPESDEPTAKCLLGRARQLANEALEGSIQVTAHRQTAQCHHQVSRIALTAAKYAATEKVSQELIVDAASHADKALQLYSMLRTLFKAGNTIEVQQVRAAFL